MSHSSFQARSARRSSALRTLAAFAFVVIAGAASAQTYPSRQITLVVPFAAGGSNDTIARVIGERLAKVWGQPIVVENQSGASGTLGASRVAKAAPDGYTLLVISSTFTINPAIQPQMPFDSIEGFAPVALIGKSPLVLATAPKHGFKTAADFLAAARANPGKLNYGSAGTGSINQIGAELLKMTARIELSHVPYRGVPLALNDLIGGHIDLLVGSMPAMMEQVRGGRVTGLAVTGRERAPAVPDLPTLDATIAPGYELEQWWAILAPARTPPEIVGKLNGEINNLLATQEVRAILAREGAEPTPAPAQALGQLIRDEIPRWQKLATQGHIRAE
jgi:tripartite-type tricarboxylate transporter receptor subunit TctC